MLHAPQVNTALKYTVVTKHAQLRQLQYHMLVTVFALRHHLVMERLDGIKPKLLLRLMSLLLLLQQLQRKRVLLLLLRLLLLLELLFQLFIEKDLNMI